MFLVFSVFLLFFVVSFSLDFPSLTPHPITPNCLFCLTLFYVHFLFYFFFLSFIFFVISLFCRFQFLLYVLHFQTVSVNVFNSFVAFDERT